MRLLTAISRIMARLKQWQVMVMVKGKKLEETAPLVQDNDAFGVVRYVYLDPGDAFAFRIRTPVGFFSREIPGFETSIFVDGGLSRKEQFLSGDGDDFLIEGRYNFHEEGYEIEDFVFGGVKIGKTLTTRDEYF